MLYAGMETVADTLYASTNPQNMSHFVCCNDSPKDLMSHMIHRDVFMASAICEPDILEMEFRPLEYLQKIVYETTEPPRCWKEEQAEKSTEVRYHG